MVSTRPSGVVKKIWHLFALVPARCRIRNVNVKSIGAAQAGEAEPAQAVGGALARKTGIQMLRPDLDSPQQAAGHDEVGGVPTTVVSGPLTIR